ncbi:MAG: amidohydrolase [Deltaproteobacteria bacterium]|nr:MAG: amidohydrolase [Deltaproteobacteria bacterium]
MTDKYKIISAVDRVVEHPEVWTRRLAKSTWGERIPHIERGADGADAWVVDGRTIPLSDIAQVGAVMPDRAKTPARWDDIDASAHVPGERIKAMDKDGVDYTVLYPSVAGFSGEIFGAINDLDLELACVRAYNDWLIEEWTSTNSRLIPQCIVPLSPVDATVGEIKRAVTGGHRGVIFPAEPTHLRNLPHINSSTYDPVWATCQELDVPLCFHAGSAPQLQFPMAPNLALELSAAFQAVIRPASVVFDLSNILFSRILLRFPKLKVVFAESTIGWGTFLLEYADHQYEQDHCNYELKPSEMFRRQCYLTAWYEPVRINARHIGTDRILWATNFPTANSTWPESRPFAEKCLACMSDSEQEQILRGNAAKLYKIARENGRLE